tara:strand:- start:44 stop:442 length:399 start_codon:yes stop_codon:yes gene_type:complete
MLRCFASPSWPMLSRINQISRNGCLRSLSSGIKGTGADSESTGMFDKMTFIGTGKMAQAMIGPIIRNGYQPAEKVSVYDVSKTSIEEVGTMFPGVNIAESIAEAVHKANCIVLAVKVRTGMVEGCQILHFIF